jgi:hypothetical protein
VTEALDQPFAAFTEVDPVHGMLADGLSIAVRQVAARHGDQVQTRMRTSAVCRLNTPGCPSVIPRRASMGLARATDRDPGKSFRLLALQ